MKPFEVIRGDSPVVLAQPHTGTHLAPALRARLNPRGQGLADTDWHIDRLYDGLLEGATVVRARFHRYVIDANRDPGGVSLYPGQNTTALCPLTDFDGRPIWSEGQEPSTDEIEARRQDYHAPYHAALRAELDRAMASHGVAVLFDCHSIRSHIPFLFEGRLPHFNVGTDNGTTCAPVIEAAVTGICRQAQGYDTVLNGRFKGGWTTRHYGQPHEGIHAIQMELAQRCYLDEAPPWTYRLDLAEHIRPHLRTILAELDRLARSGDLAP